MVDLLTAITSEFDGHRNRALTILLLNNDTVVEPDFLTKMLTRMENRPEVGIMGCRILYFSEPNRVWFNGAKINWWKGTGARPTTISMNCFEGDISSRE